MTGYDFSGVPEGTPGERLEALIFKRSRNDHETCVSVVREIVLSSTTNFHIMGLD
jgi:hypothetical protein